MLLLTQPLEMQGGGLNRAFSEGTQHPRAGGTVLLPRFSFPEQHRGTWPSPSHSSSLSLFGFVREWSLYMGPPLYTKSGGREDEGGRVRKTLQKFRDLVKTDKVSEKEHEQTWSTIQNHVSGRKAIKAYWLRENSANFYKIICACSW